MSDVFLSYAREERSRAEQMARALETSGLTVWWDRQITAGDSWATLIERELANASCVVVLWSKASIESEWVRDEAAYARDLKKLLPVIVEDASPPLGFRAISSAVLTNWNGELGDPSFQQLLAAIRLAIAPRN